MKKEKKKKGKKKEKQERIVLWSSQQFTLQHLMTERPSDQQAEAFLTLS